MNLLFLYTDEQRYDTLAAYGNTRIQMPNLDRLAGESTVFERAYVTQPVCTPSRSSLLTGLWPHTNGCVANNIPLDERIPTLAEMLPEGKYATGHHGKWHLGDEVFQQHGFADWKSIEDDYNAHYRPGRDRATPCTYTEWLRARGQRPADGRPHFTRGEATRLPEEHGKPAYLGEVASQFIRERKRDPFVLYVNFLEPHMPFFGPRDEQYDPAEVTLPANFSMPPGDEAHLKARLLRARYAAEGVGHEGIAAGMGEAEWRQLIARYWGLCSLVDTHVGRILGTLEEEGLLDDTMVVFTSDHGDMMGSHQLVAKAVLYEESVRVPWLMRMPGGRARGRVADPVSQIDMVPTILDLLGAGVPGRLQGRSLRPALESPARYAGSDVFIEWNSTEGDLAKWARSDAYPEYLRAVAPPELAAQAAADETRTIVTPDGWKLNASPMGMHELYHLAEDPLETRNLAGPEHRDTMRGLLARIRAWQEATGDEVALPDV